MCNSLTPYPYTQLQILPNFGSSNIYFKMHTAHRFVLFLALLCLATGYLMAQETDIYRRPQNNEKRFNINEESHYLMGEISAEYHGNLLYHRPASKLPDALNTPRDVLPECCQYMVYIMHAKNGWWLVNDIVAFCDCPKDPYYDPVLGDLPVLADSLLMQRWIPYSQVTVNTKNYGGETLTVYELPSHSSKKLLTFNDESHEFRPLSIWEEWVEVVSMDGKLRGWLPSQWVCGHPMTLCQ